jgi:tetratricopeptide (TPR) repeat protein
LDRADPHQRSIALESFLEAHHLDPMFCAPVAYLAVCYSFMAQTGQMNRDNALKLANEYATKAITIEPENPTALASLAMLKLFDWKWNEGFELLQKALSINGNDPILHLMAAEYYLLFDDVEKELGHARKCYELDPLSANNVGEAARHFLFAGKTEESLKMLEEALMLDPHNLVSRNIHAYAIALNGNPKKAIEEMEATHKITGDFPLVLMAMGFIYALLDEKEKAREIISKFEGAMKENPEVNFDFAIALISLHIGDIEKFHSTYDSGISKHQLWLLQFYGTIMVSRPGMMST